MRLRQKTRTIYTALLVSWLLIVLWQGLEHSRVKTAARNALINRSRDITTTLGLVIRSQRRFGGIVSQERLESALTELVQSGELISVALFNASGDVVASAGDPLNMETARLLAPDDAFHWDDQKASLVNLVDLGTTLSEQGGRERPTIVLPRRPPPSQETDPTDDPPTEHEPNRPRTLSEEENNPDEPSRERRSQPSWEESRRRDERGDDDDRRWGGRRDGDRSRGRFGRPFWMDEERHQELLEKRGLHGLLMTMSTGTYHQTTAQDLWMRLIISSFAGAAVLGLGLAWRHVVKSSDLQMRLVKAGELNSHLKEMNLAAAGLAHETRNPLNIIRGLAQLIGKQPAATDEARARSREIINETDRVTAQLNEFINYSRPREVQRSPVSLVAITGEVARALKYDLEEKQIHLETIERDFTVEADEQLLRQTLFNLVLNAIEAVASQGRIRIVAYKDPLSDIVLEVRDNGAGIAPENRDEIFKPYFTTHQKGTGLGLAVVYQIVSAHGWEIEVLPNQPGGAIFRITHLKSAKKKA